MYACCTGRLLSVAVCVFGVCVCLCALSVAVCVCLVCVCVSLCACECGRASRDSFVQGYEFEQLVMAKEANNPRFGFLHLPGHPVRPVAALVFL